MKKIAEAPYLPTEVEIKKVSENVANVIAYPFENGYAITLAHPLRRLLMSSSVGYAPIAVKINGANHEFDSIRGMLEDVAIFIINLKNIRFKIKSEANQVSLEYSFDGNKEIKGKDLENSDVEIVNPETHLATINGDCNLSFTVIVQKGIGYLPSEDIRDMVKAPFIPIDAFFSPVRRVVYNIEKMLVEDNPNFEKIIFTIETDGQIAPIDAFKESISTMYNQMSVFNKVFDFSDIVQQEIAEETIETKVLLQKIEDLNLSARSFNSLDRGGIKYLGELVLMSAVEIKNIKNLGTKSFEEVCEKLEHLGFGLETELPDSVASVLRKKLEQLKA